MATKNQPRGKKKTMTEKALRANKENSVKGGRPKGSLGDHGRMQAEMRREFTRSARDVFPDLIKAQIELARGVWVEETAIVEDKDGKKKEVRRVYKRPPSQEAVKYVMDQAIGKPKESHDHNINDKRALSIEELDAMARGDIEIIPDDEEDLIEEDDE